MASNKLARNSLDALLKASPSHKITKSKNVSVDKKQRLKLPATKTGLKRIKQEIRYGHQQKIRSKQTLAESRQNPIGKVFANGVYLKRLMPNTKNPFLAACSP
jgi:hypothetical protein